jgi:phage replication initiation protein
MSTQDAQNDPRDTGAELVPAGGDCQRQLDASPSEAPRVVTTGRKADPAPEGGMAESNVDPETGEPFNLYASGGHGVRIVRNLVADGQAPPAVAQVDALAFTVTPPADEGPKWVLREMACFLEIESPKAGRGCFGFKESMRFGDGAGLIAWGGRSQRDRVYFSIQGKGCGMVDNWPALSAWLEAHCANLKRVDVAYDDFAGQTVNIDWAIEQYERGGFNAGGRKPKHQVHGDWLSGGEGAHGRTLGIGNRASGKYCRIYEKGKQLGDPVSRWTRVEVEWRGQDRVIPYDVLTRLGQYLAGAYPCLSFLNVEQSRIKTIAKGGTIAFDRAVENARQQTGKLVHLMMQVYGGDYALVVDKLKREGMPSRIDPFSYHLRGTPERLDPDAPGSFASALAGK